MKQLLFRLMSPSLLILCSFVAQSTNAQGFGKPLTFQGVDHVGLHSAASRAGGGTIFGITNDVSVMFSNPASLHSLQSLQFSIGGAQSNTDTKQNQQYSPLKYYTNFSLLLEGLTDDIQEPIYDTTITDYDAGDSVQRPYDKIGPNWKRTQSNNSPLHAFIAVPFSIGDMKITAGGGIVNYADLDWYYQNNNVLSPSLLTPDPFIKTRPANDADSSSIPIQWYQSTQQRDGVLKGYGGAVSIAFSEKYSVGISGLLLRGNSTDKETRIERGRLRIYQNFFRAESVYYRATSIGTSDYSGEELTLSSLIKSTYVSFGLSLKLPTTIVRKFSSVNTSDSNGTFVSSSINGEDKITIPMRGTLALSLALRENLSLNIEYDIRPYSSTEYKKSDGTVSKPWSQANVFHLGVQYSPLSWLILRGGVREQAEVFEPVGNPISGEPVGYTIYSTGAGITFANTRLNFAYEYSAFKYIDTWSSAVSINTTICHNLFVDVSYSIPW